MIQWRGGKFYRACSDCHKMVQLNKMFVGSLHVCVTRCEKRGHHSKFLSRHKTGLFWNRRLEYRCMDCDLAVDEPGEPVKK